MSVDFDRIYARIDLDAICQNIKSVRAKIPSHTKIAAVIKADAYGHGAVEVAKSIFDMVDYFAVADIYEAIELRQHHILTPILILGYTSNSMYEEALKNDITLTVWTYEQALSLNHRALALNKTANIHLAIDTGMSRIGFPCNDASLNTIKRIAKLSGIKIEGIFTHFAKADEKDKTATIEQYNLFTDFIEKCKNNDIHFPIKHVSNSAAIMDLDLSLDMVREGIMLYGLNPSDDTGNKYKIFPAMSLISHISNIQTLPQSVGVSYGHTYKTTKETKVATVPAGYADGYPRYLSNIGKVLINGVFCPIIGRICMDQMMVDITDAGDVKIEDEVILVGSDGTNTIQVEDVALSPYSFHYEFICGISRRVPRVYYKNGIKYKKINYIVPTLE